MVVVGVWWEVVGVWREEVWSGGWLEWWVRQLRHHSWTIGKWEVLGGAGRCWVVLGGAGRCWAVLGGAGRCWEVLGGAGRCLEVRVDGLVGGGGWWVVV